MTDPAAREALEEAWRDLQARHALPDVEMVAYRQRMFPGTNGWFVPEDMAVGIAFDRPAERVMETLVHEATHVALHAKGIETGSVCGGYHSALFADLALELGLVPPPVPHPTMGYSQCELHPQHLEDDGRYAGTVERLRADVV